MGLSRSLSIFHIIGQSKFLHRNICNLKKGKQDKVPCFVETYSETSSMNLIMYVHVIRLKKKET